MHRKRNGKTADGVEGVVVLPGSNDLHDPWPLIRLFTAGTEDVKLQLLYKDQYWYTSFTNVGTGPVSLLLSRYNEVSRVNPANLGMEPVSPV